MAKLIIRIRIANSVALIIQWFGTYRFVYNRMVRYSKDENERKRKSKEETDGTQEEKERPSPFDKYKMRDMWVTKKELFYNGCHLLDF